MKTMDLLEKARVITEIWKEATVLYIGGQAIEHYEINDMDELVPMLLEDEDERPIFLSAYSHHDKCDWDYYLDMSDIEMGKFDVKTGIFTAPDNSTVTPMYPLGYEIKKDTVITNIEIAEEMQKVFDELYTMEQVLKGNTIEMMAEARVIAVKNLKDESRLLKGENNG